MRTSNIQQLEISQVVAHADIQAREESTSPPSMNMQKMVFRDEGRGSYWVADGFHRFADCDRL